MDGLANFSGEIYFADSMQPIQMREHIPGLWFSGRLSKPSEHHYAHIFARQKQSVEFGTALTFERLSQQLIEQLCATRERLGAQPVDHGDRRNNDALAA